MLGVALRPSIDEGGMRTDGVRGLHLEGDSLARHCSGISRVPARL